jgi:primosomal replication protein N
MNGLLVELGHVVTASMLSLTIHKKGLLGEHMQACCNSIKFGLTIHKKGLLGEHMQACCNSIKVGLTIHMKGLLGEHM